MHLKAVVFLLLAIVGTTTAVSGQLPDSLQVFPINRTGINCRNFVVQGNRLFALNDSGQVVVWDLATLDTIRCLRPDIKTRYTAISPDQTGKLGLGTSNGIVYKVDPTTLQRTQFLRSKYYPIYDLCFNSVNHPFVVVANAIYDPVRRKHWDRFRNHTRGLIMRKRFLLFFSRNSKAYFSLPQFSFLDSQDRWWLCASYGEFGGDVQVFDARQARIYNDSFPGLNRDGTYPKSVFEDAAGSIFLSSGLQHFGGSGEILQLRQNTFSRILDSDSMRVKTNKPVNPMAELFGGTFIGPGTFRASDQYLYFATNQGFYRAQKLSDDRLAKPELLFVPKLSSRREALAIGEAMNVIKLKFTPDEHLVFLTSDDGIGLYDGERLIFLR